MARARQVGLELVRALCVLTLVLFNFAHTPIAIGGGDGSLQSVAYASVCGAAPDAHGGADGQHTACPACRIGAGADLSPLVAIVAPAFACAPMSYARRAAEAARPMLTGPAGARAPPLLS